MKLNKAVLVMAFLLAPVTTWAAGSAYINPSIILQQAPQAQAASKEMEKEFKGRETNLRALLKTIQQEEEKFNKDSAIMSDAQRKKTEEAILSKKREFRFSQQSLKEDLQVRRQEMVKELQKTISGVIQAYGKKKGYDFIFTEGVAYAADSVNITDEILKELSKK